MLPPVHIWLVQYPNKRISQNLDIHIIKGEQVTKVQQKLSMMKATSQIIQQHLSRNDT